MLVIPTPWSLSHEDQGLLQLHGEFGTSLGYNKSCIIPLQPSPEKRNEEIDEIVILIVHVK